VKDLKKFVKTVQYCMIYYLFAVLRIWDLVPFDSWIRYGKNSDPGSGINIPDPQNCIFDNISFFTGSGIWCLLTLGSGMEKIRILDLE
jgi:hypothetical protein